MKLVILSVGKEKYEASADLIRHVEIRILRYLPLEWIYIEHAVTKEKEGEKILEHLKKKIMSCFLMKRGKILRAKLWLSLLKIEWWILSGEWYSLSEVRTVFLKK